MNRELDQRCLELALADLLELHTQQRRRTLEQFRANVSGLADKSQLELLPHLI